MLNLKQKATPWVSYVVLGGCICITAVLVYASQRAFAIADEWSDTGNSTTMVR